MDPYLGQALAILEATKLFDEVYGKCICTAFYNLFMDVLAVFIVFILQTDYICAILQVRDMI